MCCKTIFGAQERNIDSKTNACAQFRFKICLNQILLLLSWCSATSYCNTFPPIAELDFGRPSYRAPILDTASLAGAMRFPTSGLQRASKLLINHNFKVRTSYAQSRALEKSGPGRQQADVLHTGAVHSPVRGIPPQFEIFAAMTDRRILGLRGTGWGTRIRT